MNLLLLGLTLGTLGKIILGVAVLLVHVHILKEHKIDAVVLKSMKREQLATVLGLVLIVVGYLMEVFFYAGSTNLLTCTGNACAAAVGSVLSL
jgi:ABC-type iron transport system FetAB permease component